MGSLHDAVSKKFFGGRAKFRSQEGKTVSAPPKSAPAAKAQIKSKGR